jgi:hypothetical protein
MSTAEVSDVLGITPASVHKLVREGFLGVKDTKKYKSGSESYFDCSEVNKLLPMMPALRRKWQQAEDRRLGAQKAAFQRAAAAEKAVRHTGIKKNLLLSLENYPERAAALLRASFFLYHLNHYAKGGEKYLYDLKEKILKRFQADFSARDGLEVFFVEGEQKVLLSRLPIVTGHSPSSTATGGFLNCIDFGLIRDRRILEAWCSRARIYSTCSRLISSAMSNRRYTRIEFFISSSLLSNYFQNCARKWPF